MRDALTFCLWWLASCYLLAGSAIGLRELATWLRSRKSRNGGTPLDGGSRKPSASTGTKEPGTLRQATAIQAASSSSLRRGGLSVEQAFHLVRPHENSSTVRGSFTAGTAIPGVSGAPEGRVV